MRALTYPAFGGPITVAEVADPVAPPGGAIVGVHASGLYRSDWHGWLGHDPDITAFPHIPGHEFAGAVAAVGEGVDAAWVGRSVTAPFVQACGRCPVCRDGDGQVCPDQRQPGFSDPGSFAELVVVHAAETNLVALPDDLDPALAAGLGCRVATAYRAVALRADVRAGERVAVLGCGGGGLAAIAVAVARGASVAAVDTASGPLQRAREVGASHAVLAGPDVLAELAAWSGGGVDVSIDAVGSPATCREGVLALARRGRHVQVGLLPPAAGAPQVPMDRVIAWELDVLGSHGMAAADYPAMLEEVVSGRLDLSGVIAPGPVLTLEQAAEAIPRIGDVASPGLAVVDPRHRPG